MTNGSQEFKRGRSIGLKEVDWTNRRIAHHLGRGDVAIRRSLQENIFVLERSSKEQAASKGIEGKGDICFKVLLSKEFLKGMICNDVESHTSCAISET
ncbi:hypothetical protein TNCV_33651 [Trichonephila clavipes]|nr:hypothetical protein TNCV_33651 [Trichonephila clavipes]